MFFSKTIHLLNGFCIYTQKINYEKYDCCYRIIFFPSSDGL